MPKPTLYILTGLPYSGKTTLTNELANRYGFKAVSMDAAMDARNMNPVTMTQADWDLVYSTGYEAIKTLLSQGESVVLDCGNLPKSERETPRNIAKSLNLPSKLIYIKVPKEEILRRFRENAETKVRDQLADETLNTALSMFEEPTEGEQPIIYNQNMDLEEWLKTHISEGI